MRENTHLTRLLAYLKDNDSITQKQCTDELGNTRLASTVFKLNRHFESNGDDLTIISLPRKVPTRFRTKDGSPKVTTVAEYKLVKKPKGIFGDAVGEIDQIIADVFKPFTNVKAGK